MRLLRAQATVRAFCYDPFKMYFRRQFLTLQYHVLRAEATSRFKSGLPENTDGNEKASMCIGILLDPLRGYENYVAACIECRVSYRLVDLFATDWIEQIRGSGCDIFVVWPGECIAEWKKLFDERLLFLTRELGKRLYPSYDSLWLYGSKERQCHWLKIHGFPQPKTWVYYRLDEALTFVQQATYPVVAKTDIGAASYGVRILKTRSQAERLVRRVFSRGIVGHCADRSAWQWQHILLQEYLTGDFEEWRLVRIGDSYFGHRKGRGSHGLHSGSGLCHWEDPGTELLDLLKRVTDAGNFKSMCLDIFRTVDGHLLISECQAVFGCATATTQMKIRDVPGRYLWLDGAWRFEAGEFCGNYLCDLRIRSVIEEGPACG